MTATDQHTHYAHNSVQHVTAVDQHGHYARNPAFTLDPFALQRLFEHVASLAGNAASAPNQVLLAPRPVLYATEHPSSASINHAGEHHEGRSSRPWLRDTPQSLALPVPQPTVSIPSKVGCQPQKICSFWYHFKECTKDPNNPQNTSNKVCNYLHYDGPGMEHVKVQYAPWHHNKACGLEKCPQRDGRKRQNGHKETSGQDGTSSMRVQGEQPVGIVPGIFNQAYQNEQATLPQASNQLVLLSKPKKRKNKKSKKRKLDDLEDGAAVVQVAPRVALAPAPAPVNHHKISAVKALANETCFFWYHGKCKRGNMCPMLHGLTQPPSFVQPPPDYMHYVPCNLDWCPGDQRHEQETRHTKRVCLGPGIKGGMVEEDGMEEQETASQSVTQDETEDGEWFLSGFPDA